MSAQQDLSQRARTAYRKLRKLAYKGHGRECSCCGQEFRRFRAVGDPKRPDTQCPNCGSRERHRLLALVATRRTDLHGGRTLHFAPEPSIAKIFRPRTSEYVTTDLLSAEVDVQADITKLPFEDNRWELIIAAHVLEHVQDDASAMRELRRVLSPEGHAILLVPRNTGQPTDEDASVTDPVERKRRWGKDDHVRIYGDDLETRLRANGFTAVDPISLDSFTAAEVERYRLRPINPGAGEAALICS